VSRPYVPLFGAVRTSTKLAALDDASERLYTRLLTQCDDWGRHSRDARLVMADCWPLLGKDVAETERCLLALEAAGLIETRGSATEAWIQVPDWDEKGGSVGKKDHRKASRWPDDGPRWPGDGPAPSDDGPAMARPGPRARAENKNKNQTESQSQSESQTHSSAPAEPDAAKPTSEPIPGPEPDHPHGRLVRAYTDAYEAAYRNKAPFSSRDAKTAAQVLELAGGDCERASAVVRAAFADAWWRDRGVTLAKIKSNWSQFLALSVTASGSVCADRGWEAFRKAVTHWAQRRDAPDMPKFEDARVTAAVQSLGGFRQYLGGIEAHRLESERKRFLSAYSGAAPTPRVLTGGGA